MVAIVGMRSQLAEIIEGVLFEDGIKSNKYAA
jgi:hypothetical protein